MRLLDWLACALASSLILASSPPLFAQQPCPCPEEPPGAWVGSAGLGFALNRGNTDTTNLNITFDATYDPKKRDVWKFQALYMRGENDGEPTVDRLLLQGRYERNLNPRTFLFGELAVAWRRVQGDRLPVRADRRDRLPVDSYRRALGGD